MAVSRARVTTENPELADRFNRVLSETVEALEEDKIGYVFIGGIASGGLGRPRSTHDIDVFVKPEDAERALRALAKHGFRTERTDPVWLYKGFKDDILVDVIFKSKGEIYLDAEMVQRIITAEFHGKKLRLVLPEDLIIIKALAHSEVCPNHWADALALLSHANLDWDYLLHRAKRAPRRVLSLLLYGQSNDTWVPKNIIDQLYFVIFGDHPVKHSSRAPSSPSRSKMADLPSILPAGPRLRMMSKETDGQVTAHIHERLAEDDRTHELDIVIEKSGDSVLLRGEVLTPERRDAICQIISELYPDLSVIDQIRIAKYCAPSETEEIS